MQCVKTGCIAYFPEYQSWSRGDLYEVGNTYVFYGTHPTYTVVDRATEVDIEIYKQFHKETKPYEIWVAEISKCIPQQKLLDYWKKG